MMQIFSSPFPRKKPEPEVIDVQITEDGLIATKYPNVIEKILWAEIDTICTFKVDCFTYDTIWLAFFRQEKEELHISEEVEGFDELMSAVNEVFSEINPNWYIEGMLPPFAENFTILFRRK